MEPADGFDEGKHHERYLDAAGANDAHQEPRRRRERGDQPRASPISTASAHGVAENHRTDQHGGHPVPQDREATDSSRAISPTIG